MYVFIAMQSRDGYAHACVRTRIIYIVRRTLPFQNYYGDQRLSHAPFSTAYTVQKRMSDSIEFRSLTRCRDKLVTALKLDAVTVANALVSSNLIPPAVSSEIGELASSERKANHLVDCIFAKVQISHTHYSRFIAVLSQLAWLNDIVEILNSTHCKFGVFGLTLFLNEVFV